MYNLHQLTVQQIQDARMLREPGDQQEGRARRGLRQQQQQGHPHRELRHLLRRKGQGSQIFYTLHFSMELVDLTN